MTLMLKLLRANDMIAPILSIIGNLLLFYLILTVNKLNMKQISFVLIPNCILDILLAIMTFAMAPLVFAKDRNVYVIVGSPFSSFGFTIGSVIMHACSAIMITSMIAVCIPFYLRYLVICNDKIITYKHIIRPYVSLLIISCIIFALMSWCFPSIVELSEEYKEATQTPFWLDEYKSGPVFVASKIDVVSFIVPYGFIFGITSVSYAAVIYFCFKIGKTLRIHISHYSGSKILSKQLHKTLIIQAIGPLFIANIPVASLLIMTFLKIENQNISLFLSFFLGWIPVVNPVAAITVITPYRAKLKQVFGLTRLSSIAPTNSQHFGGQPKPKDQIYKLNNVATSI